MGAPWGCTMAGEMPSVAGGGPCFSSIGGAEGPPGYGGGGSLDMA